MFEGKQIMGMDWVSSGDDKQLIERRNRAEIPSIESTFHDAASHSNVPIQITHLHSSYTAREDASHPIQSVLPELLSQIFIFCLPTDRLPKLSAREAPLLLTWICRTWRTLALSTPQLWSSVEFTGANLLRLSPKKEDVLRAWFARSGILPLDFRFTDLFRREYSSVTMWEERISDILKVLSGYSRRWRSITLGIRNVYRPFPGMQHVLDALSNDASDLPLRELDLRVLFPDGLADNPSELDLGNVPYLKQTGLTTSANSNSKLKISLDSFLNCLLHFQRLESVNITIHDWTPSSPSEHSGLITLQHLKHFHFRFGNNNRPSFYDPGQFFDNLCVPLLEEFELHLWQCDPKAEWRHLPELFQRSQSHLHHDLNLTELWIDGSPISFGDILKCLKYTPNLAILRLGHIQPALGSNLEAEYGRFMDALTPAPEHLGRSCVCPRLEGFELRSILSFNNSQAYHLKDYLVNFLRGRMDDSLYTQSSSSQLNKFEPGSGRLRALHIVEDFPLLKVEDIEEFEPYLEMGFELEVDFGPYPP